MKISSDQLASRLARELAADAVAVEAAIVANYSVDDRTPVIVCHARSEEEVSSVLRLCGEADAAVTPWGGGTFMKLGNVPRRLDVVLALDRIARLIEHDDANLTATVEAGMTAAAFQRALAERRQFLPVDPPRADRATLGGLAAANINGPRRGFYGGLRDLVVGMKMVLGGGERVKTGGKVVKNVAGYDLAKLFIGSLGTLGVITQLTFRVSPRPQSAASFVAAGSLEQCARFAKTVMDSPLLPAAVVIAGASDNRESRAVLWIEGFEEALARHLRDLGAIAARAGLAAHALRDEPHERLWGEISGFGWDEEGIVGRVVVPAGALEKVVMDVAAVGRSDEPVHYVAHGPAGTIWLLLSTAASYAKVAAIARENAGHAIVAAAPATVKAELDVWGEPPASLPLMCEIKRQFDRESILNPGRFVAGI